MVRRAVQGEINQICNFGRDDIRCAKKYVLLLLTLFGIEKVSAGKLSVYDKGNNVILNLSSYKSPRVM